jgi:threonyl-tRNA synthetase
MIILGDKEVNEKTISVRTRKGTEYKGIPVERFITNLMEEIKTRKAINHLEEVPHLTAE